MKLNELAELMSLKSENHFIDSSKLQEIYNFYQELRNFVDNLNLYKIEFIEQYIDAPINKWYQLEKMPWLKGKCVVGIMGRYSTGKTTLMNSLLKLNLPTNSEANTALPTYIAHGFDTEYRIFDANGEIKCLPERMINIFDHDYSNNFPFSKLIQYMVLNQKSDILQKISFLDTPGISNNERDMNITSSVVSQCDIVFWLVRAIDGQLDVNFEIPFIKNHMTDEMYVVITFTDECPDVESVKRTIENTLKKEEISYRGILEFTKDEDDIDYCLKEISDVLHNEANDFQLFQPINLLEKILEMIRDNISEAIKENQQKKNEIENNCLKYLKTIERTYGSLSNSINSSTRGHNSLVNTVNSNCCRGFKWCTDNKVNTLVSSLNDLIDRHNEMIRDFNKLDVDELIEYGQMQVLMAHHNSIEESLLSSRNQSIEFMDKLKNLFKI